MKCDECVNILEAYLDGEAGERDADQVQAHLMKCEKCSQQYELLTAESELYARYDPEVQISPAVWNGIAARISADGNGSAKSKSSLADWFAGLFAIPSLKFAMPAIALVAIAVVLGLAYWRTRQTAPPKDVIAKAANVTITPPVATTTESETTGASSAGPVTDTPPDRLIAKAQRPEGIRHANKSDDGVLFKDAAYTDLEDRDTVNHLEQAQNLLVSIRNIKFSDDDEEVDVSYEKSESRRLLNENVVLRRDAEAAGKFPAKSVLGSLEPFLIDIANLPDKATPTDVRQITDRVQKTEIVAELRGY